MPVSNTAGLIAAIGGAQPGDEIVLANGTYELSGNHGVNCSNAGTPAAPIVVRAAHPLGAHIVSTAVEAFAVSAPNWRFEGLDIRGACADDSDCEHAFHVTGRATGFQMLRNRVADFNAQLKVNADGDHNQPDGGLVEGNEFLDTHPRHTSGPVTPVNIDIAADWVVRGNVIRDFHKVGGNEVSYGAYAKGGARRPLFERNLVLCADLDMTGGTRIGLSLGGGGMDPALCAPKYDAASPLRSRGRGRDHQEQHRRELLRRRHLPQPRQGHENPLQHADRDRGHRVPFPELDRRGGGQRAVVGDPEPRRRQLDGRGKPGRRLRPSSSRHVVPGPGARRPPAQGRCERPRREGTAPARRHGRFLRPEADRGRPGPRRDPSLVRRLRDAHVQRRRSPAARPLRRRTLLLAGAALLAARPALAADKVVRVGINLSFTGGDAENATRIKDGALLAFDEANAAGEISGLPDRGGSLRRRHRDRRAV